MKTSALIAALVVVILVVLAFTLPHGNTPAPANSPTATATYSCDGGKSITASFYNGDSKPATSAGQPPTPGGSVHLALSDGRTLDLAQTISADGARYSDGDPNTQGSESFVFWSKGNGALVLENNQEKSYIGCIEVAPDQTGNLSKIYSNGSEGFSIRYPEGYTLDESYTYQALGPGKDISGTKFTIPASRAAGTNLSNDSYLSVEEIPQTQNCSAALFLDQGAKATTLTEGDMSYSVASTTGAGAGNRYEETVYAIPGTNPCLAVRYFVHYGVFENYPAGSITAFDRQSLLGEFDSIRRTLTVNQ